MLKRITIIMFVITVFLCLISCQSMQIRTEEEEVVDEEKDNLLLNPSFEDIKYWEQGGNVNFCHAVERSDCYDGDMAFGIKHDVSHGYDLWGVCYQVLRDPDNPDALYPVKPGDIFTFKMWVKLEKGYNGYASLKLEFFRHDRRKGFLGGPLTLYQSDIIMGSCDWTEISVSGEAPEGTVSVVVVCVSEGMKRECKFALFDKGSVTVK